jgi:hypothetical protein
MNSRFETLSPEPIDNGIFDRLVDGSLAESERRALLLRLEAEPGGWRRCALAFLEAQSWREAFAPLAAAPAPQSHVRVAASVSNPSRTALRWVAVAASLLAAFVLGWTFKHVEPSDSSRELARETAPVLANSSNAVPSEPVDIAEGNENAVLPSASSRYVETVVKAWQNQGYSAERQNTFLTMTLQDGSELEVPAEEIRLHYTGGRTY